MNYLSKLDMFGSPYMSNLKDSGKKYRSPVGGILTMIVYSLSLLYFIYKMYLLLDGQVNANVAITLDTLNYLDYSFDYNPISIDITSRGEVDPFDKENNILYPKLLQIVNYQEECIDITIIDSYNLLDYVYNSSTIGHSNLIIPPNISMVYNNNHQSGSDKKPGSYTILMLEKCNPQIYDKCANQTTIDAFLNQFLIFLSLNVTSQQFDHNRNQLGFITRRLNFAIEKDKTLYDVIAFKFSRISVSRGFLIQWVEESLIMSDFSQAIQSLGLTFFESFSNHLVAAFQLEVDQLISVQSIQYPQISQILAEVGSIMSTLLVLQVVAMKFNQYQLEEEMIATVIGFYFPSFKDITLKYNWFGQVKVAFQGDTQIELRSFQQIYRYLRDIAKQKLIAVNQIYEVSRLQFICQSKFDRQTMNRSHKIGISLNWKDGDMETLNNPLQMDDYQLLTKYNEQYDIIEIVTPSESEDK